MATPPDWENLLSPFLSGTLGATLARWLFSKALKDLADMPKEIGELKEAIISMKAKLEVLDEIKDLVHLHDKQIAVMEVQNAIKRGDRPYKGGNC